MKSVRHFLYEKMSSDSNNSTKNPAEVLVTTASSPTTSIVTAPSTLSSPGLTPTSTTALKIQQPTQQSSIPGKPSSGFFSTKSQKGRRKISLPWFRQNSVSSPHAALSRQHTIDSPGSFRFFRQASNNIQVSWIFFSFF